MMLRRSPNNPPPRRQQQPPQQQRTLTWVAGAAASALLLLLLLLLLLAWERGTGPAAGGGGLRLFDRRRPAAAAAAPAANVEGDETSTSTIGQPSLRRRPGQALGATDVLWGLEPRCLAVLYTGRGGGEGDDGCGCTSTSTNTTTGAATVTVTGASPLLAIVDGPEGKSSSRSSGGGGVVFTAGSPVRFTVRAAHACSDVVNAAFHSPGARNALGHDVTVPARVVALDEGGRYAVTATLHYPGEYVFKAWVLWEGFAPRVGCRDSPCRRCLESVAPRYTSQAVTRAVTVVVGAAGKDGEKEDKKEEKKPPLLPVCATLEAMLDGAWVQDPTLLAGYAERVREEEEEAAATAAAAAAARLSPTSANGSIVTDTTGPYTRLAGAWVPAACRLPLHSPQALQAALAGKHLHFIGDSTTREFMHGLMRLLWPERPEFGGGAQEAAWVPNDYDSGASYTTRFSFNWVGGAATNESMQGLAAVVSRPQRFLHALPRGADFVFVSAGTHDVAGRRGIPEYAAALSTVLDWVAARVAAVGADPRRVVWRPALPLLSQFFRPDPEGFVNGSCRQEHSAALQWMRLLGAREARKRGFAVLDAYRVAEAEDVGRAWSSVGGQLPCSRDGMHYAGCDSFMALLGVYLHHVVRSLEEEGGKGGRGLVREAECGLASCS